MKKTNRTRKSQCQKDALWTLYKELSGETPSREQITSLSEELNLKENQIYKWFWDTKKKVEEDTEIAKNINMNSVRRAKKISRNNSLISSRSNNHLRPPSERECIGVDGKDGMGEQMTPQQIKTALKIH